MTVFALSASALLLLACVPPAVAQSGYGGYGYTHGVCEKKADVHYECPYGFEFDADSHKCVKYDYQDIKYYCPEGTKKTAEGCVKYVYEKKIPYCKHGKLDGHKCFDYEYYPVEYQCPYGYGFTADKAKCYADKYEDKLYKCPYGYDLTDDKSKCFKYIYADLEYYCPAHSYESPKGCKTTAYEKNVPYCKHGYLEGHKCVKVIDSYPSYSPKCKAGYTLHDGKCVKKAYYEADYKCPSGYSLSSDYSKCWADKYEDKKTKCPYGFEFDDETHKCIKYDYADLEYYCPAHFKLTPRGCKTTKYEAKSPYCKHGYLEGGKCVAKKTYDVDYECKYGYQLTDDGSKCYASKKLSYKYKCPYGYELLEADKCVKPVYAKVAYKCAKGKLTFIDAEHSGKKTPVCCVYGYHNFRGGSNSYH
ncbi:unnamed protein product [Vitrella brassicaformis CCMP3155]|uniref:Uncharacterized protein n=1 Tax=Vitrella brassicaformis (strain CCMP3155) TaxID=1169540 RepID=A0A0G4F978_VITBC|nr:unnamed protein product [Vitrella brassicaformis CCMP3155]|eukprot:CEM08932.1 unnamed protein product [Vitrella brassicaformis CCMP3155]